MSERWSYGTWRSAPMDERETGAIELSARRRPGWPDDLPSGAAGGLFRGGGAVPHRPHLLCPGGLIIYDRAGTEWRRQEPAAASLPWAHPGVQWIASVAWHGC